MHEDCHIKPDWSIPSEPLPRALRSPSKTPCLNEKIAPVQPQVEQSAGQAVIARQVMPIFGALSPTTENRDGWKGRYISQS